MALIAVLVTVSEAVRAQPDEERTQFRMRWQDSVVKITTAAESSSGAALPPEVGTGFIAHPDGFIITAAHVVREVKGLPTPAVRTVEVDSIDAQGGASRLGVATVLEVDLNVDLALLKLDPPGERRLVPLVWAEGASAQKDRTVRALGWGIRGLPFVVDGTVANEAREDAEGRVRFQLPLTPSDSGCPILDANGRLVGTTRGVIPDSAQFILGTAPDDVAKAFEKLPRDASFLLFDTNSRSLSTKQVQVFRQGDKDPLGQVEFGGILDVAHVGTYSAKPMVNGEVSSFPRVIRVSESGRTYRHGINHVVALEVRFFDNRRLGGLADLTVEIEGQKNVTKDDGTVVFRGLTLESRYEYKAYFAGHASPPNEAEPFDGTINNTTWRLDPTFEVPISAEMQ